MLNPLIVVGIVIVCFAITFLILFLVIISQKRQEKPNFNKSNSKESPVANIASNARLNVGSTGNLSSVSNPGNKTNSNSSNNTANTGGLSISETNLNSPDIVEDAGTKNSNEKFISIHSSDTKQLRDFLIEGINYLNNKFFLPTSTSHNEQLNDYNTYNNEKYYEVKEDLKNEIIDLWDYINDTIAFSINNIYRTLMNKYFNCHISYTEGKLKVTKDSKSSCKVMYNNYGQLVLGDNLDKCIERRLLDSSSQSEVIVSPVNPITQSKKWLIRDGAILDPTGNFYLGIDQDKLKLFSSEIINPEIDKWIFVK